jgi:hypothetical protein
LDGGVVERGELPQPARVNSATAPITVNLIPQLHRDRARKSLGAVHSWL